MFFSTTFLIPTIIYAALALSLFYYNLVYGKIPRVRIIFQRQFYVLINPKIEAKFNKATATN